MRERVLVIGLDGFEISYAEQLMAQGELPALAALRAESANLLLDHGSAQRTGLGWEHFWSGRSVEASGRDSAVEFDPSSYTTWQEGARFGPFFAPMDLRVVVLDPPYVDLHLAPGVEGVVAWGAHDPGVSRVQSVPAELLGELESAVGAYPSERWTYARPWPSEAAARAMGEGLVAGVEAREAAAKWLLADRLPEWDLAVVVVAETHAAAEGLWHGIDPEHLLHGHPSAPPAAAAMADVYRATDRLVGNLVEMTAPSAVIVFNMGGMGPNRSDAPSMILLPELLSRWALGEQLLDVPDEWSAHPDRAPVVSGDLATWPATLVRGGADANSVPAVRRFVDRLPRPVEGWIRRTRSERRSRARPTGYQSLAWQPATWYQPRWREMRAFALPSFYDGRVRLNLEGREAEGLVELTDYWRVCDEIEALVRACIDPRTGQPVVEEVERLGAGDDPMVLGSAAADLVFVWRDESVAFEHPQHGLVGPVNVRRTGGHTGPYGFVSVRAPGVAPGDHGIASSFDVVPTIVDLLGEGPIAGVSGESFLTTMRGGAPIG